MVFELFDGLIDGELGGAGAEIAHDGGAMELGGVEDLHFDVDGNGGVGAAVGSVGAWSELVDAAVECEDARACGVAWRL